MMNFIAYHKFDGVTNIVDLLFKEIIQLHRVHMSIVFRL
jgi:hypothetical protein